MSKYPTKTPGVREENDFYPTPDWAIDRLLEEHGDLFIDTDGPIYEPCVGDGAIVRGFRRFGIIRPWLGRDIIRYPWQDGGQPEEFQVASALDDVDVLDAVTNPPFSLAMPIVERLIANTRRFVCVCVRVTWLESRERNNFMRLCPPKHVLYLPRRFEGGIKGGSDTCGRVWCIWDTASNSLDTSLRIARF